MVSDFILGVGCRVRIHVLWTVNVCRVFRILHSEFEQSMDRCCREPLSGYKQGEGASRGRGSDLLQLLAPGKIRSNSSADLE